MKNLLILFSFIFSSHIVLAQNKNTEAPNDTLISVFNPANAHKDGYEIGRGNIIEIPIEVVSKCAHKKIMIIGKRYHHVVTEEDLKQINDKGEIEWKQGRVGAYSTFTINTIWMWDAKKKTWKLVYENKEKI